VKTRKRPGFTLDLGADVEARLNAFVATYYTRTKHDVIREAIIAHIESVLARPEERERLRRYRQNLAGRTTARSPKGRTSRSDHP
jgi:predicted DNA-binding protein